MKYIHFVGDSIFFGSRDEYHRSPSVELSKIFWEKENKKVFCANNSIPGETSGKLLKRIYQNCKSCTESKLGCLLIGTNDTQINLPVELYEDNMRQIIMVMQNFYKDVCVGLLPRVYGSGLLSYPKNSQEQINKFNEVILKLQNKMYFFVADFTNMKYNPIDTVHFSNNGYKEMAEILYKTIKEEGIII